MTGGPPDEENPVIPFLLAGPQPDRTRWEGWQQWRAARGTFTPAPRLTIAEYQQLSPRGRALHDLHRTATHVNLRLQETPMSKRVSELMRSRLQNNAVKFAPGTRDGLMISGSGFQGKTETACQAAAEFEDLWRDIHRQLVPGPAPGTRDVFVPVAYCRLPVKATPKGLCKTILDIYGDPHPSTLHDLVRAVRDAVRDHATTALLIDDITRLKLHRGDDQDTLDLIRELMDLGATLVVIGVDIPGSGLLGTARPDPASGRWAFPAGHAGAAATQTGRRFELADLGPFDYSSQAGISAFIEHLAGIEDQIRLMRSFDGMLTAGEMPEYLFRRTGGVVGLLRRLIEDSCAAAIAGGRERLTRELLDATPVRLPDTADLDPDSGEIPDIPPHSAPPQPKKKRRPRNTVFDDHGDRPAG